MPIIERTPRETFDVFVDHLRGLVAATVTDRHPILELPRGSETRVAVSFREGDQGIAIPIDTAYGRLHFYLGQALEAVPDDDGYRLTTRQYWYRVQHEPSLTDQAIIRWEYDAATGAEKYARHHTQIRAALPIGDGEMDLNKAHVPTGWVTFEEVIRFLIVDLEVKPPCGDDWPERLIESERVFFEEFTGKRHKPASGA